MDIPIDIRTEIGKYISKYGVEKNKVIKYLPYEQYFLVLMINKVVFVSLTKECAVLKPLHEIFSITDCEQILSDLKQNYG